jgi:large subunit ribosomal protein L25
MKLAANNRTAGNANTLRHEGQLPGIVYNNELNIPISVEIRAFDKVFRSQGMSHVIDLDLDGKNHEVLVKQVQMDKRRRVPIHVDFYEVTAGQKVQVGIVIDFIGTPAAAKEGGQIDIQRREVLIDVIPRLIPERLELDISHLDFGDSLHVSDIASKLPPEAEILDDESLTLVTILAPRLPEEEEEDGEEEMTVPEVIGASDEDDEEGEDTE